LPFGFLSGALQGPPPAILRLPRSRQAPSSRPLSLVVKVRRPASTRKRRGTRRRGTQHSLFESTDSSRTALAPGRPPLSACADGPTSAFGLWGQRPPARATNSITRSTRSVKPRNAGQAA
jgi:hypothetical protein